MVLAQTPKVLLLDEPTTGLDATHRLKIREIIRGLSESTCVITTSHSPDDLDSLADHLIVFKDGESVFDGPGLQFLRSPDAEQARSWDTALAKVEEAEE
jgi:ABC-type multidrug transport system ATPase subunit